MNSHPVDCHRALDVGTRTELLVPHSTTQVAVPAPVRRHRRRGGVRAVVVRLRVAVVGLHGVPVVAIGPVVYVGVDAVALLVVKVDAAVHGVHVDVDVHVVVAGAVDRAVGLQLDAVAAALRLVAYVLGVVRACSPP